MNGKCSTIIIRGIKSAAEEAERALHDAICVIRYLNILHCLNILDIYIIFLFDYL